MNLLAAANNSGNYTLLIFLVVMIALMYFTMYRPQKKQQQQRQKMLNQIKVGDPVTTIGGLHGVIDSMNDADKTVVLDCDGIYLTFSRSAIRNVAQSNTATASQPVKADTKSQPAEDKSADTDNENVQESQKKAATEETTVSEEKTEAAVEKDSNDDNTEIPK